MSLKEGEPAKKKAKKATRGASTSQPPPSQQATLKAFFQPAITTSSTAKIQSTTKTTTTTTTKVAAKKEQPDRQSSAKVIGKDANQRGTTTNNDDYDRKDLASTNKKESSKGDNHDEDHKVTSDTNNSNSGSAEKIVDPIVPKIISPPPPHVVWQSLHDNHVILRIPTTKEDKAPRTKVAAFDLDGTLVVWSPSFSGLWPSQLTHYEIWSSTVATKLRHLYDEEGYKLVLFSNQGGIQGAHSGKKATLVKHVINFLAYWIDRPLHAVVSTKSPKRYAKTSFHKPSPKMWQIAVQHFNHNVEFDLASSFFVGDSADPNDDQGGVDLRFANAVTELHGGGGKNNKTTLQFHTPIDYFGPSDSERRDKQKAFASETPPPPASLQARSALLGGYLKGPILLLLCGVQGSGKSTFCNQLIGASNEKDGKNDSDNATENNINNYNWIHLSQDTINNGKPGKREKVEAEAIAALQRGQSVVVDRMHLDPEQRSYFVQLAESQRVPVHAILLNPGRHVISQRVKERTNHPGKVQGEEGVKRALQSLDKLVAPTYQENLQLIHCASTIFEVTRLATLYQGVQNKNSASERLCGDLATDIALSENLSMPTIALGTMGMGKKVTKDIVLTATSSGFRAIDTAPTYKNEDRVGDALSEVRRSAIFCIAKVPKAGTQPKDVRSELESTLTKLQRPFVDLLLLHWPCDVIASGTLESVWKEMENLLKEGKCKALGTCNFNVNALAMLLANCTVSPVVNQVERHPLLAQMDLMDFCMRHRIILQAHTPLGQGKEELLSHASIQTIAAKRSLTPAQVVLRWSLQQGCGVVPKFSSETHAQKILACTTAAATLLPEDMKLLDSLDQGKRFVAPPFMYGNQPYCWGTRMPRK
ncbi:hypothetical protein ACA910_005818 [Epithemia clementina (nom. ined.)]